MMLFAWIASVTLAGLIGLAVAHENEANVWGMIAVVFLFATAAQLCINAWLLLKE